MLSWRAPDGVYGRFRAVPEVDFGPIRVVGKPTEFEIAKNAADEDLLAVGRPAPEFELLDPERGTTVALSSLRGRPVILNFYCGCAWCEAVAEKWARSAALPGDPLLIAVLNEDTLGTPAGARKFRERTGFKGQLLADPDHKATLLYGSSECPRVWVLDAEGTIRHVNASRTEAPDRILAEAKATLSAIAVTGSGGP